MNTKLTLTKEAVIDAAKELINDNGHTTNLEIKEVLRDMGYFATQAKVSEIMNEHFDDEGMTFDFVSPYRVYKMKAVGYTNPTNPGQGCAVIVPASNFKVKKNKVRVPYTDATQIDGLEVVPGDWEVWDAADGAFYKGNVPRNTARYAFSKHYGAKYCNTSAIRVK